MKPSTMTDFPSGLAWRNHFRRSLLEDLQPRGNDPWAPGEREILGPSLAQFQLGESSDGRHLLTYARRFGDTIGDSWLAEAMALFIQEENRHSHWLGEFLKAQQYPLLRACWSDAAFRLLRKLMGFGLMISVLVCAEIVAAPYYTAVRSYTASRWLRAICTRLLNDEAIHLRFQAANLGAVWRRWKFLRLLRSGHKVLMGIICLVVWREHGAVLRQGGYTPLTFLTGCLELLDGVHAGALLAVRRPLTNPVPNGQIVGCS
jgi:hypothetical protein